MNDIGEPKDDLELTQNSSAPGRFVGQADVVIGADEPDEPEGPEPAAAGAGTLVTSVVAMEKGSEPPIADEKPLDDAVQPTPNDTQPATDTVPEAAEVVSPEELQQRAEALIREIARPDVHEVAKLVQAGLTPEMILTAGEAAGYERPHMTRTLQELPVIIDYMQQANDVLVDDPRPKIYAARDAEYMYDDLAIRHPDHPARLLNASGPLFYNMYQTFGGEDRPGLSHEGIERFFAEHGLTDEMLREQPVTVVDSGFRGTIGRDISNVVRKLQGKDFDDPDAPEYVENGLLNVKLLAVRPTTPLTPGPALGTEILDSSAFPDDVKSGKAFPKTAPFIGEERLESLKEIQPAAALGTAMQLLPHHTQEYSTLIEREGMPVEAVSSYRVAPSNVDVNVDWGDHQAANASIVHPVAALIVQAEVVRRALAARAAAAAARPDEENK